MRLTLQKGIDPATQKVVWLMLDENYELVEPIQRYLTFLSGTKSPNTVEAYGNDLKLWWQFLYSVSLDWRSVQLADLEDFAYWLRVGNTSSVVSMQPVEACRSERTINRAITTVMGYYEFHIANQTVNFKEFDRFFMPIGLKGKTFLAGIAKTKPMRRKLVKLKEPKKFPGCLTDEQVELLVNACKRLRDKLIILMLNGTGMRKGELLGLTHDDIGDFDDYSIKVVQRDNPNGARVKGQERIIPVTKELLQLYEEYLIREYPESGIPYIFVNIWEGEIGQPLKPNVLNKMFNRLSEKVEIKVYPHLFRHTYATRLLRLGMRPDRVSYLLGHTSVQTTLDIYSHIVEEGDMIDVIKKEEDK
ncbi:tyrosine-type recombinase/integrase [Nostoc sphaeroides]|uniref:Site-specific tyrosine recombinase n=1 Tax=Nostoc sphaeroides CCNUC1 TaxID=2653204 RepID=A0A5P8WJM5_9NOSO|nr:tyrosine-type recombinase/integrase [Nostoc sphaeroides]QFS52356.1 Site-specific tyrosine recombinase [Nostoc sphaeroides CCNUC1]